ncbi:Hypothetical predicted protein [Marmota monax]|uniref:Serpin domain-containing protein n=1 Tax=Marmota monax TaxID=9995 RepID=A0A5E4AD47_MARMO|nr:Hypothetical predicted protein [Marmota monax]
MVLLGVKGNTKVQMAQVENNLTFEKFIAWTKPDFVYYGEDEDFLPRFKLQGDRYMETVLQRLGMVDAFQQGQADLSAMSTDTDLCLSKFLHKSVIEVNEEGTEAAATMATDIAQCRSGSITFTSPSLTHFHLGKLQTLHSLSHAGVSAFQQQTEPRSSCILKKDFLRTAVSTFIFLGESCKAGESAGQSAIAEGIV